MALAIVNGGAAHAIVVGSGNTPDIDSSSANLLTYGQAAFSGFQGAITDSKGNTPSNLTTYTSGDGTQVRVAYVEGSPVVGSGHHASSGTFGGTQITAWSGAATSAFDQETGTTGNSSSASPGTVTPASANSLIWSACAYSTNGVNASSINVGTLLDHFAAQTGVNEGLGVGYEVQSGGPSSSTPTFTLSGSSPWAAALAVFKAAAGGGTQALTVVAAGGIVLGGIALQTRARAVTPAGGLVFAGTVTATLTRITSRLTTGGPVFGGTAPYANTGIQHLTVVPAGGITLGGIAGINRNRVLQAAGGLALSGAAALVRITSRLASGGVSFAGTAATGFHEAARTVIAAGGIVFSGHAVTSFVGGTIRALNYLWFARRKDRRK